MAKRKVLEVVCDRCHKTETVAISETNEAPTPFILKFKVWSAEWNDLCTSCHKTVTNYVLSILKVAKKEDGTEATEQLSDKEAPPVGSPKDGDNPRTQGSDPIKSGIKSLFSR